MVSSIASLQCEPSNACGAPGWRAPRLCPISWRTAFAEQKLPPPLGNTTATLPPKLLRLFVARVAHEVERAGAALRGGAQLRRRVRHPHDGDVEVLGATGGTEVEADRAA